MTFPDPVFFESWLGYNGFNDDTIGARSRWAGPVVSNIGMIDMPPHRTVRYTFGSIARNFALFDRPITDGLFCWHTNLAFIDILASHSRDIVQLVGANPNNYLIGIALAAGGGRLRITRNNPSTVLGLTPPGSIPNIAMHSVIVHGRIHPTLGQINVLINGVNVLSLNNIDTRGTEPDNEIHWAAIQEPSNGFNDNRVGPIAVFNNNVAMKPARFERLAPSADSTPLDFVRDSGGHNFSRINEEFYSNDGFVTSSTPGASDVYELGNMAAPPAEIYGVNIRANMHKLTAGTRVVQLGVVDNGVDGFGQQIVLPSSRISTSRAIGKSPDTGSEFTFSQINALRAKINILV